MNININLDELSRLNLSPNEYIYLYLLYTEKKHSVELQVDLKKLEDLQFVSVKDDEVYLRASGLAIFEVADDFSLFVAEYRNLFPKGVKSGNGTPVRGNKSDVEKKMKDFMKIYPQYSKLTILNATKNYILYFRNKNSYTYMTQADNLISKDKISKLASLCEEFENSDLNITTGENRI
jgi:hypothetical protein